ncbi:uncharacterized protein LOC141856073 [Brevipalpus obovatus]|uniref:uncharacterized protein LOC141856073 n=1 Tax=Brevipalpus obovatus TaxID=246614 RepID=UPI003D9E9F9C
MVDVNWAMNTEDRPLYGRGQFGIQEPRSPCFSVLGKFFRFYGVNQVIAFMHTGMDGEHVRRFDVQTERGSVLRGFCRPKEHFNIGVKSRENIGFSGFNDGTLMTSFMTQEEIDECKKSYINIPRNAMWGIELHYDHKNKSFGDTFLGSQIKIKERRPPKEENLWYTKYPEGSPPTYAEHYLGKGFQDKPREETVK